MSTELLESIKRQIHLLTAPQKEQLAAFLKEQVSRPSASRVQPGTGNEELHSAAARLNRMEGLKAHQEQYGGQYVALQDDQLIAVGSSYRIARESAISAGKADAFITYLPSRKKSPSGEAGDEQRSGSACRGIIA
jgi:hypothetical protein